MRLRELLLMVAVLASAHQGHAQALEGTPVAASAPAASEASPAPQPPGLSASDVRAAVEAVRADPLLPGTEKTKVLRFKKTQDKKKPKPDEKDSQWWVELLASFTTGMRVAMWLVGAGLLIWVLLRLRDWVHLRQRGPLVAALPPTHVGSLDIRPESLPDDIGGAARGLWQRGDVRAALSLLYRGALSRLVHSHGVPIRAASTENECVALAAPRLDAAAQGFLAQLVTGWQMVAYAQRHLAAEDFEQLCADFDTRLPAGGAA